MHSTMHSTDLRPTAYAYGLRLQDEEEVWYDGMLTEVRNTEQDLWNSLKVQLQSAVRPKLPVRAGWWVVRGGWWVVGGAWCVVRGAWCVVRGAWWGVGGGQYEVV